MFNQGIFVPHTILTGGFVGGSGTLNYVAKWTPNGVTIGNSVLYDDGTNVSIGNTSPAARLDIIGTGSTSATYTSKFSDSSLNLNFYVRNDGQVSSLNGYSVGGVNALHLGGTGCVRVGNTAMIFTAGSGNTAVGFQALNAIVAGASGNVAIGMTAGAVVSTGTNNTFIGHQAGMVTTIGAYNVGIGPNAISAVTTGLANIGIGYNAIVGCSTGNYNVAIGHNSLVSNNGDQSVALGFNAGFYETASNKLFIDNNARTSEADGRVKALIYGVFATTTANQYLAINAKKIATPYLPTGNTGVATGELYVDTAANILANSDLIVARKG